MFYVKIEKRYTVVNIPLHNFIYLYAYNHADFQVHRLFRILPKMYDLVRTSATSKTRTTLVEQTYKILYRVCLSFCNFVRNWRVSGEITVAWRTIVRSSNEARGSTAILLFIKSQMY